ncbi:MAG: 2'-5' RNA ligase family protein [Acidobacteria bacterium]|nr:2'-5' RNA ligase family protein [Acidobacteriota bacterium]
MAKFVDDLRQRFNPACAAWLAHVTILPPRPLQISMEESLATIRRKCLRLEPFSVSLDSVSTFWPANGVVYLSFSAGAQRLAALHDLLNQGGLAQKEPYPFVPHVTVAQELDETTAQAVLQEVSRAWEKFEGDTSLRIELLSLVQQAPGNRWVDLAPIALGSLASLRY